MIWKTSASACATCRPPCACGRPVRGRNRRAPRGGYRSEQRNRFQEAISLHWLGLALAARGVARGSESALQRSLRIFVRVLHTIGMRNPFLPRRARPVVGRFRRPRRRIAHGNWRTSNGSRRLHPCARLQVEAALGLNDFTRSRRSPAPAWPSAGGEPCRRRAPHAGRAGRATATARRPEGGARLLDDVWEPAERGPYPLFHADACNVLAQIERDAGDRAAAVEAATKAYRLAWCDGEPYAYHGACSPRGGTWPSSGRRSRHAAVRRIEVRADAGSRDQPGRRISRGRVVGWRPPTPMIAPLIYHEIPA